jgi:hypothetical protein
VSAVFTAISDFFGRARDTAINIFESIKTGISEKIEAVKNAISTVFGAVKDIMSKPFETAKEVISGVIEKIKGFLNFNWEFPKLKLPHFSVSGTMNPLKWIDEGLPKISVEWYAKGGIFSKPTIFNTPYGLKGVGDAPSPEVVAPLSNLTSIIGDEISKALVPLYMNQTKEKAPIIDNKIYLDGDVLFRTMYEKLQEHDYTMNYTYREY